MVEQNSEKIYIEIALLILIITLITLLHYSTLSNKNILLHEISQRLYYLPIIYAAYRYGLKGSVSISLLSGAIYLLHVSEHLKDSQTTILNQYAEVIIFQVVAITTGFFADAERTQRKSYEKVSQDLIVAYKELRDTVDLLVRTAQLKSLGELSASIAHEIRNPLASIKGSIEIIATDFPADSPKKEFITIIEQEIERLNRLVEEFLRFAKPSKPTKIETDINEIIMSVTKFISTQAAKTNINIVTNLASSMPLILMDNEQIRQVLLNLIINAIQASPPDSIIEISSKLTKDYIELFVRDYGKGVENSKREKIFEPFFTTKPQGSGLGLAIAYQLVKQHNGEIMLLNTDSSGALFIVKLPIIKDRLISNNSEVII